MSSRNFLAAALGLSLAVVPAAAQTREIQTEVDAKLATERARLAEAQVRADRDQASRERYEEIEIMARLLDRGLDKLASGVHAVAFSPDGKLVASGTSTGSIRLWDASTGKQLAAHAGLDLTGMQGVYLKGQGIVYSATIPQHFQKPVAGPDKPAPKALTPWERVRKELHGEKVEAEKAGQSPDPSIADAVLKVLAENGKNLTRLPEEENVTVAVTLLPAQACVTCHSGGTGAGSGSMMRGGMGSSTGGMMGGSGMGSGRSGTGASPGTGGGGSVGSSSGGGAGSAGTSMDAAATLAEFRKNVLVGDLAMKQNDYQQAADAYRRATSLKVLPGDSATELEYIEVATKWAGALIAQGKTAEAEKIVEGIGRLTEHLKKGEHAGKPAETKSEMALPAKLVITVAKKDLDLVGSKRIDFEAFRKAASVEYLTFDKPATEKPKGATGAGP